MPIKSQCLHVETRWHLEMYLINALDIRHLYFIEFLINTNKFVYLKQSYYHEVDTFLWDIIIHANFLKSPLFDNIRFLTQSKVCKIIYLFVANISRFHTPINIIVTISGIIS